MSLLKYLGLYQTIKHSVLIRLLAIAEKQKKLRDVVNRPVLRKRREQEFYGKSMLFSQQLLAPDHRLSCSLRNCIVKSVMGTCES